MKKTLLLLILVTVLTASFKTKAPANWVLDGAHSQLGFSISLIGLSDIKGTVKFKEGTIKASKDDFSDAEVNLVADMSSIDTDNDDRDKHLRTADFFDTEKYPVLVFKSGSFKNGGANKYKVTGDLSMHGITKQVVLDVIAKTGTHPVTNKTVAGFRVTGTIRRTDFGVSAATPAAMLSDEVVIESNLQFIKD